MKKVSENEKGEEGREGEGRREKGRGGGEEGRRRRRRGGGEGRRRGG